MFSNIIDITVEEVDEPARKTPQFDIDRDSAMGLSVFTGGKSTTLSEVSLLNYSHVPTFYCSYYVVYSCTSGSSG